MGPPRGAYMWGAAGGGGHPLQGLLRGVRLLAGGLRQDRGELRLQAAPGGGPRQDVRHRQHRRSG